MMRESERIEERDKEEKKKEEVYARKISCNIFRKRLCGLDLTQQLTKQTTLLIWKMHPLIYI